MPAERAATKGVEWNEDGAAVTFRNPLTARGGESVLVRGGGLSSDKNRARSFSRARPSKSSEFAFALELEAKGELNLALAEERAAGFRDLLEARVEGQGRARRRVDRRVDVRHLRAVEDVEAFDQRFEVHRLLQMEASRQAQVGVDDARHREGVAGQKREARRAARTVDAACRVRPEASRGRRGRSAAGLDGGERRARVSGEDRRDGPAVKDRAADLAVAVVEELR